MSEGDTTTIFQHVDGRVAAVFILLYLVWNLARQLQAAKAFRARFLWLTAILESVLLVAAVAGFGSLAQHLVNALSAEHWQGIVSFVSQILVYLAASSAIARILEVAALSNQNRGSKVRLTGLTRTVLYGLCLFVGLLVFLIVNDYSPTELYVSTGAAAALVAFAMQQTLGDLFSGIALSIERPFRIGDWLRLQDGAEGQVIDMNWRATTLRGWDNTSRVVPNSLMARQAFTNLHGSDFPFAPWYFVQVSEQADPQDVVALLETAALRCAEVQRQPAPIARLFDGSSVPYTYMVWVHFQNYPAMFAGREQLYREVRIGLREAGLRNAATIKEVWHRPAEDMARPPQRGV